MDGRNTWPITADVRPVSKADFVRNMACAGGARTSFASAQSSSVLLTQFVLLSQYSQSIVIWSLDYDLSSLMCNAQERLCSFAVGTLCACEAVSGWQYGFSEA
jgi:hypothetical protein